MVKIIDTNFAKYLKGLELKQKVMIQIQIFLIKDFYFTAKSF